MKSHHHAQQPRGLDNGALALLRLAIVCTASCLWPVAAQAQQFQGPCNLEFSADGGGPYDYRSERGALAVVERRHFTPKVELLRSGESSSQPGPDISYTLNKYPNHHRALIAMSKLGQKLKTDNVPEMRYSITCYFERATHFRPNDTVARLIYAQHLALTGKTAAAKMQMELASTYAEDNALTHYNIGLIALELKEYDTALKHAHIAYGLGITAPQLRDQLMKSGKWVEAPPAQAGRAMSPASAASATGDSAAQQ